MSANDSVPPKTPEHTAWEILHDEVLMHGDPYLTLFVMDLSAALRGGTLREFDAERSSISTAVQEQLNYDTEEQIDEQE
jgi:hypothetical protein